MNSEDYFEKDILKHTLELMGEKYPYDEKKGSMKIIAQDNGKIGIIFND